MTCRGSLSLLLLVLACTPQPGTTDATTATTSTSASETSATTTPTSDEPGTTTPTTGEPPVLQRCAATCSEPAGQPCRIDGGITVFLCIDELCQLPVCTGDELCHQLAAGWVEHCSDDAQCTSFGFVCIDPGDGDGRCAPLETRRVACADLGLVPLSRTPIAGGDNVTVCGDETSTCVDNHCFNPCKSDLECPPQLGQPHCDLESGLCTCSDDGECQASGQPGLVACLAGTCGCQVDDDCAGGQNVDTCVDGACGCSSTAVCTVPVFDNVVPVCQPA